MDYRASYELLGAFWIGLLGGVVGGLVIGITYNVL